MDWSSMDAVAERNEILLYMGTGGVTKRARVVVVRQYDLDQSIADPAPPTRTPPRTPFLSPFGIFFLRMASFAERVGSAVHLESPSRKWSSAHGGEACFFRRRIRWRSDFWVIELSDKRRGER
jgi:hypothetical protein